MPYVGSPFQYDVFISYAHAERETGAALVRDWSRYVALRLQDLLASALNPTASLNSEIKCFLDDRVLVSGQPLTETIRDKVQKSALLIIFMSPLYAKKSWCLDELEWFLTQPETDGRGKQHCIVLRIQPLPGNTWPERLKDERGEPLFFHDLADPDTELPLGLENFDTPTLQSAIRKVFIETKGKLKEFCKQIEARRTYEELVIPPDRPVVYLHAHVQDVLDWQVSRKELSEIAIVNPDNLVMPVNDDALFQREREQRLREYELCDAIVLLRARSADSIRVDVMAAYKDRRWLLQQRHLNIPWAILDRIGDDLPIATVYRCPRVVAKGNDWPDRLIGVLGLSHPTSPSSR